MNDHHHSISKAYSASNPEPDPASAAQHELLREQARDWLVRLTSGSATTDDAREYKRWCGQSVAHAAAMAEVGKVWAVAQQAGQAFAGKRQAALGCVMQPQLLRPGRRAFIGGALAAGVAGWMLVRPPGNLWPALSEMTADYRTGTGEQRELLLNDDVRVALNTQTSANLMTRSDGRKTGLELGSGEVQIDTPGKAGFVLRAGNGQVTTRSAARYNVRIEGKQVCVTCLSGKIEVSYDARVLIVNASLQISYGGGTTVDTSAADIEKLNAWRRGVLVFDNVPLASVVEEINRYRPGKIILSNEELGRRRVQAQVRLSQLADVVGLIQAGYGAKVTSLPAGIVVLS